MVVVIDLFVPRRLCDYGYIVLVGSAYLLHRSYKTKFYGGLVFDGGEREVGILKRIRELELVGIEI